MEKEITTYSMWNLFRNCRRACFWRYEKHLVPVGADDRPLRFGTVIHEALRIWHTGRDLGAVLAYIDRAFANRSSDPELKQDWHYATAMMKGYTGRYPVEEWEGGPTEVTFQCGIENPMSRGLSRTFRLAGKVDGLIQKRDGTQHIIEHKTASVIGGDYVERLWTDLQITLYTHLVRRSGALVNGVLYNVLVKPKLVQARGESEEEFQARSAELAARNKSGKSSAQRRMPESDEEFQARLATWYSEPDRFVRVELLIDDDAIRNVRYELWELTQQLLIARRRYAWYQNTSYCFHYGRPCPYWPICASKDNPVVIQSQYLERPPHTELNPTGDTVDPVF